MSRLLFGFLLLFCLMSCDPQTDYKMIVQNSSKYEILINNSIAIPPGTEKSIYDYLGKGGPGSNDKCEAGPGGIGTITASIPAHPELKVTKDLSDMNNWTYAKEKKNFKGIKARCRASVTDTDITNAD